MNRRRGDAPPNPGIRRSRTMQMAQARTALMQAVQAGIRPTMILMGDETRRGLQIIEAAARDGNADVIIARLVGAEVERIEAEAARIAATQNGDQP